MGLRVLDLGLGSEASCVGVLVVLLGGGLRFGRGFKA